MTENDPLDGPNDIDDLLPTRPAAAPSAPSTSPSTSPLTRPRKLPKGPLVALAIVVIGALLFFGNGCSGSSSGPGRFIPYPGNGGGPTQCEDGSYSHSSGPGTCSWHGGVDD